MVVVWIAHKLQQAVENKLKHKQLRGKSFNLKQIVKSQG